MNDFSHPLQLIATHPIILVIICGCYLFSVVVGAMTPLPDNSGYFTTWAYSVVQALAGNLTRAGKLLAQSAPMKAAEAQLGVQVPAGSTVTQTTKVETPVV